MSMILVQPLFGQEPRVFVLDDAVKMSPDGKIFSLIDLGEYAASNPVWDGKSIKLSGAKAETVAFQVMVGAGKGPLSAVSVQVSDLKGAGGTIPAAKIALFREWYVKVTRPSTSPAFSAGLGEYPDALIPADVAKFGLPIDVAAEKIQGIWVDVAIPRDAKAGPYKGTVTVTAKGQPLARLELTLNVYGFAIPAERHLRWRIGYSGFEDVAQHYGINASRDCGKESEEFRKMEEDLYKMCWEGHRFVPTTHYNTPRPETTGRGAEMKIQWASFDRRFGKYLDGSAFEDKTPINIFSLPVNVDAGWPTGGRTPDLARLDTQVLDSVIRQIAKHWDEKGWKLEDTFAYMADEPAPERYPFIKKACEVIHNADKRIRTSVAFYTHFGPEGPQIVKEFSGYVTMWDIAGDYMNLPALAGRQAAGDTIGFYQGSEPFEGSEALDGDGFSLTTWPWIAWRYKLDTLFLYNMTEWSYFRLDRVQKPWGNLPRNIWTNPLNQSWQTNSQGVLLYPGDYVGVKGVIPSIRMKQIRRGMQDYEYFWLASEKGQKARAEEVAKRIIPKALHEAAAGIGDNFYGKGQWNRDPRNWAAARTELAKTIQE